MIILVIWKVKKYSNEHMALGGFRPNAKKVNRFILAYSHKLLMFHDFEGMLSNEHTVPEANCCVIKQAPNLKAKIVTFWSRF